MMTVNIVKIGGRGDVVISALAFHEADPGSGPGGDSFSKNQSGSRDALPTGKEMGTPYDPGYWRIGEVPPPPPAKKQTNAAAL